MKNLPKVAMGAWAWGNDGAFVYGMGTSEKILGELLWN